MPDTVMHEPSCPTCGDTLERTTLLWPDPDAARERAFAGREILIERPGLWCSACGSGALEAAPLVTPLTVRTRRAA